MNKHPICFAVGCFCKINYSLFFVEVFFIPFMMEVMSIDLKQYAWDAFFAQAKNASDNRDLAHGRVLSVHKSKYEVVTEEGIFSCNILGNIQYQKNPLMKPAVGDWVLLKKEHNTFIIYEVLPRKTLLKRQKKHDRFPKPIATNVDTAVVVQAVGGDVNIRRLERILVHIYEAHMRPVIVFNKIDKAQDDEIKHITQALHTLAHNIPVFFTSSRSGEGMDALLSSFKGGETIIFLGSSGVGKSSIINFFLGDDVLKTQEVMNTTGKGRHTTTRRKLLRLDNGILIIDTPGTREFGMHFDDDRSLKESFAYIETLAQKCQFSNCRHTSEPGCAVQEALARGDIEQEVYDRYKVLHLESRKSAKQMRQGEKQSSKRRMKQSVARSVRRGK